MISLVDLNVYPKITHQDGIILLGIVHLSEKYTLME